MTKGTTPSSTNQTKGSLTAILKAQGLQRVAIVDDYYDPPEHIELSSPDKEDLWGLLEFEDEALAELAKLGNAISGSDDLIGPMLASFFANREQCPTFDTLWRRSVVGQRRDEQYSQLAQIETHLRDLLELSVATFGRDASVEEMARESIQLFLLDWHLGDNEQVAIEAAVQKANDIHKEWPADRPRPLIVLMSSQPSVTSYAEEFRRRSGLLAGMFYAVPKKELSNTFSLQMHLQILAMAFPTSYRVQEFVDALREKVKTVGDQFAEQVGGLTLSDYAYIQSLSLQADGQPLGDYLMWLLSAYFGHLLFSRELRQQREELDSLAFTPLPSQTVPSPKLAEMYRFALFDVDVGPVTAHPLANSTHSSTNSTPDVDAVSLASERSDPMLSLGDIFMPISDSPSSVASEENKQTEPPHVPDNVSDVIAANPDLPESDLIMIVNAQCDLAFTPEGSRTIERDRSILLLPGKLHLIKKPIPERYKDSPRTELYERDGRSYRILWNTKEVKTVRYGEFRRWHDGELAQTGAEPVRYKRIARLRLPFALEVQRAFAADLTRVGMPVAPPIYDILNVNVLGAREKQIGEAETLSDSEAAFLVLTRDGHSVVQQCVLTLPLVQHIKQMLENRLAEEESRRDELASQVDMLPVMRSTG